jgi:hypothetical protein
VLLANARREKNSLTESHYPLDVYNSGFCLTFYLIYGILAFWKSKVSGKTIVTGCTLGEKGVPLIEKKALFPERA